MPATDCIEALGDWQGCVVGTVERFAKGVKGSRPEIWLELMPDAKSPRFCSSCGKQAEKVHDTISRHGGPRHICWFIVAASNARIAA